MLDLVLRNCRLPERAEPVDLAIADGRIVAVGPAAGTAREALDVDGRLVTPGLVEAHIHLDKALLTDRMSGSAGTADSVEIDGTLGPDVVTSTATAVTLGGTVTLLAGLDQLFVIDSRDDELLAAD